MATQTVEIRAVDKTQAALGRINKNLQSIDNNAKGINTSFGRIAAIAGSVFAGLGLAKVASGVLNVSRRFEDLRAQLKTVTGSVDNAAIAFEAIQQFAATTPFTVGEITDSFVILKRFGIDATIPSLKAFGNIAAANNRTFTQFAEAVADALTGEFERLKEFGIKVSKENDKFVARLGDQQLGVANSSTELIEIIRKLGEEGGRFGTGIEDRANTLSGALSNLQDSTEAFSDAIGQAGLNESLGTLAGTFGEAIRNAIPLAQAIGANLAVAVDTVNSLFLDFDGTLQSFSTTTKVVLSGIAGLTVALSAGGLLKAVLGVKVALKGLFALMARNPIGLLVTAIAGLISFLSIENGLGRTLAQVSALFDKFGEIASGVGKFLKNSFNKIVESVTGAFDSFINSIIDGINAVSEFLGFDKIIVSSSEDIRKAIGETVTDAYVSAKESIEDVIKVGKDFVDNQIEQDGVVKDLVNTWTNAGIAYDNAEASEEALGDTTKNTTSALADQESKLKKQQEVMGNVAKATDQVSKAQQKLQASLTSAFTQLTPTFLVDSLNAVVDAQKKVEQEITENKVLSEQQRNEALAALNVAAQREQEKIFEQFNKRQDQIFLESLNYRLNQYRNFSSMMITEDEKRRLQEIGADEKRRGIIQDRINFEKKSELEKTQFGLDQGAKFFQGLSAYNKKFFAAYKAFAIAQAIINTYQGATKALATYPPPFNFIAAAATVASGLAQVATIRAQTAQRGGTLIGGSAAVVGEDGPELIVPKQPSTVIPREVKEAVEGLGGGGSKQDVTVNFNITTVDAASFDQLLVERRGTIVGLINQAVERRGRVGVV